MDTAGNAYLSGGTYSTDFPVTPGAFQPTQCGRQDAFVAKLDPTGANLGYSTYLGGSDWDVATAITLDAYGNAYVAGASSWWSPGTPASGDFPTTPGAFQRSLRGTHDAFVAKLDERGHLPVPRAGEACRPAPAP